MNKSNRPVIVYGNDFSLNISVKRYDAQTDDYIDLDLSQVTDLEVYLTCSNNNTTIPLDFTTSGSYIKCQVQYRFLAPQTSYGIVVEAFDEENKHFRFEALPREGFLVVSNTSGFKPAENVDVVDIKARIGWGNTIDAYTKEEMNEIIDPISERLTDAEGTLKDHATQIDDLDNNIAINTADIATNKSNITKNTRDIKSLDEDVENKQDVLVSGKNIKTINNKSILGKGNVVVGGADYSKEYFTIESLEDNNTITFEAQNDNVLSYSTDGGTTWTEGNEVTVNNGDKVWWKGSNLSCNPDGPGRFSSNRNFKVSGNVMSLEFGDDFVGQTTITKMYQFYKLFSGCKKIVDAKDLILPATTLAQLCYETMFLNCKSLTKAPELPATTLAQSCYTSMFDGCTSLTKAPELPATTLTDNCYTGMFSGCESLIKSPELPATTLAQRCYNDMFFGCKSLTKAPELPATTLTEGCYSNMFNGCTKLTITPELPATTLTTHCYDSMFYGCTSLTKSPELPANALAESCYYKMFHGCTKLQYVKMMATYVDSLHGLLDWMSDVSSTGTMLTADNVTLPEGASGIPTGWKQIIYVEKGALDEKQDVLVSGTNIKTINNKSILGEGNITIEGGGGSSEEIDYSKEYFTIESLADNNTITFSPKNNNTLSYSIDDGTTWTQGHEVTINNGDKVLWKGSNLSCMYDGPGTFTTTSTIKVYGNTMSFEFGDDFVGQTTLTMSFQFANLFNGCKNLIDAKDLILPATTLSSHCCQYMFQGCTSLVETPELPAITLVENCYDNMFSGCTSLTKAPDLPATTLGDGCYNGMFAGCTSLVEAPELPATTLQRSCYQGMFFNCTSLTKAPDLPATTLPSTCYHRMFFNCTSLTKAPDLPATTLPYKCYAMMFWYCSNVTYIKMLATNIADGTALEEWFRCANSTGTMITSGKITLPKDSASGIPTGWTELQYADPAALAAKQDVLVSGTNIKTINNESILGEGNITIEGGGGSSEEIDYSKEYLTIESLEDNNEITWCLDSGGEAKTISVSTDNGSSWTDFSQELNTPTSIGVLNKNEKILIKGTNSDYNHNRFNSSANINVSGNIMSLVFGDDFVNEPWKSVTYMGKFAFLFRGTPIIDASNLILPLMIIGSSIYESMFANCASLVKTPKLPAQSISMYAYKSMFQNCTSLVEAPELPATTLAHRCYDGMFQNCKSLTKAPELLAPTLESYCYSSMFYGCTSLTKAPELPAVTLVENCYQSMFQGCTSLTKAPELPATTLAESCYYRMFKGCTRLQSVKMLATKIADDGLMDWMYNVASSGTMITSGKITLHKNSTSGIPTGWTELQYTDPAALAAKQDTLVSGTNIKTINNKSILGEGNITIEGGGGSSEPVDYSKEYFTIESLADNNTITFTPYKTNTLSYSIDNGTTWTSGNSVTVANGDKVMWKGSNLACGKSDGCGTFKSTGNINVSGNIMSLEFGDDFASQITITKIYQFLGLFHTCITLLNANDLTLPATTLAQSCYTNMFYDCSSLLKAPELPATTLAQSCYTNMFSGCTSLTKAPELPATTLARMCYKDMFEDCTSLTKAPELPATTLAQRCYDGMFGGCKSLTKAPELLAPTLESYCYSSMFYGCTKLKFIKMLATDTSATGCLSSWVNGVASSGTIITSGKATLPKDSASGIPTGWTELPYTGDQYVSSTTSGLKIEVVDALPTPTVANTIYLVRSVSYNLTTATNVSELQPGQAAVIYYQHNVGTEITSASAGQLVDISINYDIFNQDRPDYATKDVEGNWVFSNFEFSTEVEAIGDLTEGGTIVMPASDVHCIAQYTWNEDTPPEPEG